MERTRNGVTVYHADGANAGVARRTYDYTPDAQRDLGPNGVTVTGYAYAWNARRGAYDVVRAPSRYDDVVTRHMVAENPDGARERALPRWTDNTAQPYRPVRVFDPYDGGRMVPSIAARIGRSFGRVRVVAPGNPDGATHKAHTCPPEEREPRTRKEERRDGIPNVPHTCTRTHATRALASVCKAHAPNLDAIHAQAYAETIARINARDLRNANA